MVEFIRTERNELNIPLLPHGSDDHDDYDHDDPSIASTAATATTSNVSASANAIASTSDPEQLIAAARAIAGTPARRRSTIDAAEQRRRRLARIQNHLRNVDRRIRNVSDATDQVSHQIGHPFVSADYRRIRTGENNEGEDNNGDDGDDELPREKIPTDVISTASIMVILTTAGIAMYLATLWYSLSPVMQCFVALTFFWLACAMMSIVAQYWCRREEDEEVTVTDSSSMGFSTSGFSP